MKLSVGLLVVVFVSAKIVQCAQPVDEASHARSAAFALTENFYNESTGLFDTTGWWNSANALTALLETMNGDEEILHRYQFTINNTYELNLDAQWGNFTNDFLDDTAWWGLAWVDAYDLTKEMKYLKTARIDAAHMHKYWDNTCGGGVWWSDERGYKNAITNTLYLQLNAALYNRLSYIGDPAAQVYLQRAIKEWRWFQNSGMINAQNLINDGLDTETCQNNDGAVWSYNQGVPLAGLVELAEATRHALTNNINIDGVSNPKAFHRSLISIATRLADASTSDTTLNPDGILADPCEFDEGVFLPTKYTLRGKASSDGQSEAFVAGANNSKSSQRTKRALEESCGGDGPSFKGIFVRHLKTLSSVASGRYDKYLEQQVASAFEFDRSDDDLYGLRWRGPIDQFDAARQQSALDLMNYVL